jgi:hypothetical protein
MIARTMSARQCDSFDRTALFTIGYETATVGSLLQRFIEAGVQRVVDVRELPLSRRRGFSKPKLSDTLSGLVSHTSTFAHSATQRRTASSTRAATSPQEHGGTAPAYGRSERCRERSCLVAERASDLPPLFGGIACELSSSTDRRETLRASPRDDGRPSLLAGERKNQQQRRTFGLQEQRR